MRDYTNFLPDECLALIFNFLTAANDRNNSSLVSRRWLRIDAQTRTHLILNARSELQPFIPSIFNRFNSLSQLVLRCASSTHSINDNGLRLIAFRCPNLTRLKISGCGEITDKGMAILSQNCKKLKKFSCSACDFGAKGIIVLLNTCSSLEELSVKYLHSGRLFEPLIIGSNNLKTLKLNTLFGDWDRSLEMIAVSDNSLVEVHLAYFDVSDIGLLALSKCSNLQVLHLHCLPHCTNTVLISVAENCKGLKNLYIEDWNNSEIGDEGLTAIGKHSVTLQELSLTGVNASCVSLEVIATNCEKLVRITLSRSETISDMEISCIAQKCVALKFLCIEECGVSNKGIEALGLGCPNLVNLNVTKCRKVTREVGDMLRAKRWSLVVQLDPPLPRACRGCFTGNNQCGCH